MVPLEVVLSPGRRMRAGLCWCGASTAETEEQEDQDQEHFLKLCVRLSFFLSFFLSHNLSDKNVTSLILLADLKSYANNSAIRINEFSIFICNCDYIYTSASTTT